MALRSYRGMMVGLVAAAVVLAALVGCGDDDDTPAASNAAESTTAPTFDSSTTASPSTNTSGATSQATSTTAPGATTTRPAASSTAPRPGASTDFTVDYPTGWGPAGQVLATAFANGATCGSALIVDRAGPADSGPGASVEHSFVQMCWKGIENQTLAQFMAATYGSNSGFQPTTLGGRPAQVSRAGTSSTYFVDTSSRRYQVTTGVAASDALRATRLAQVDHILASLTLPD